MAPDTDGSDEVSTAWRAEAAIRLAGIRAGTVELVNADEHYAELRASLNAFAVTFADRMPPAETL